MPHTLRKFFSPSRPTRHAARPTLEVLDERLAPAVDVAVLSARLDTPTQVRFTYQATGNPASFDVGVYRSSDAAFDATDVRVATATVNPPAGNNVRTGTVALAGELPTDLTRKYVLVVARATGDTNPANDTAGFRKWAIAAVTHGLDATTPAWVGEMASALKAEGYDDAIPFTWVPLSALPTPGGTTTAGQKMAAAVRAAAAKLAGPNDAVDVHLIGHSRGTSVVSQAFRSLDSLPGSRAVRVGYSTETLLDPHVAANPGGKAAARAQLAANTGEVPAAGLSYDPSRLTSRLIAAGTIAFQAAANDPAAFAPPSVDRLEVFYQQLDWDQTPADSDERRIGMNLKAPDPATIVHSAGTLFVTRNVGEEFGVSHTQVQFWYLATLTAPAP